VELANYLAHKSKTVVWFTYNKKVLGAIAIADMIRPEAARAMELGWRSQTIVQQNITLALASFFLLILGNFLGNISLNIVRH
jgi:cation transport ATPase